MVLLPVGEIFADGMGRAYGFARSNDMEVSPHTLQDSETKSQEEAVAVAEPASPEPNGILTPTVYMFSAGGGSPKTIDTPPILGNQGSKINFLKLETGAP